jgi:molybdopterin/thiamine biosynthesis adenylyltransferase
MTNWWEDEEGGGRERYEREIKALADAGFDPKPEVDPASGLLNVRVRVPVRAETHEMLIRYPANYWYFRFELFAPTALGFGRHQHPESGALCLIDQGTRHWKPSELAATVIRERIDKIVAANEASGPFADEAQTPEPISMYFEFQDNSAIIFPPEAYAIDSAMTSGRLDIQLSRRDPLRGYVERIDGTPGTLPDLSGAFPKSERIQCEWIRIPTPRRTSAAGIEQELIAAGRLRRPRPLPTLGFDLVALLFEEEVGYRGVMGPGWALLLRRRERGSWHPELIRVEPYDPRAQSARIAPISALETKTVFQIGTGCVGAPAAHLLAQSRLGRLRLADPDTATITNSVRWPLGFPYAGVPKVNALATFLRTNYPETKVDTAVWALGRPTQNDADILDQFLDGVDAILDCTAEIGIQQFLANEARQRGLPYVMVEATPGGFGGYVAVFGAGDDEACWMCLQRTIEDEALHAPLDRTHGVLQLPGCSAPTFTAAAFDIVPLSALSVRVLVQELVGGAYASRAWNVAVLRNRDDDGGAALNSPSWQLHALRHHARCRVHGGRAAA